MVKRGYEITARGEMSPEQLDIILRYLGKEGLSTEVQVVPTEIKPEHQQSLGHATYQALMKYFYDAGKYPKSAKYHTRLWNTLAKVSAASDNRISQGPLGPGNPEGRGHLMLNDQMIEVFKIAPDAEPDSRVSESPLGGSAIGYELNLDSLEVITESGMLGGLNMVGPSLVQFAQDYIVYRRLEANWQAQDQAAE